MKSSIDLKERFFQLESTRQYSQSQLVIIRQSNKQIDQNQIDKTLQIEPVTLITLNQNIVNYKIGTINEFGKKKNKYELECSPSMSKLEYQEKKNITKKSIFYKLYIESIKKKQKDFILLIFCSIIFLCCLTFQITKNTKNYSPDIKGLF